MEVLDLSICAKLTSLADVNRILSEINARERSIEALLEGLQANRAVKEQETAVLHISTKDASHNSHHQMKDMLLHWLLKCVYVWTSET